MNTLLSSAFRLLALAATLAMVPALVFFLAMQRRIVNGLQGAVKG